MPRAFVWAVAAVLSVSTVTPGLAAPGASESLRCRLTWTDGEHRLEGELEAFDLPGSRGGRRWVVAPSEDVPGLPLLAFAVDGKGTPKPQLIDTRERGIADAFMAWLEADGLIPPAWRVVGAEGTERLRIRSTRLRQKLEVRHACRRLDGAAAMLEVTLAEPAVQEGNLRIELESLVWKVELDEAGLFRKAELTRTLRRSLGGNVTVDSVVVTLEVLERTELTEDEARSIVREFESLAEATRALLPGQTAEAIEEARGRVDRYRTTYQKGRLADAVVRITSRLEARKEELAGGSLDERAEKLIGQPAPDFTLTDLDGEEVTLASLRGNPIVLSFWGVG